MAHTQRQPRRTTAGAKFTGQLYQLVSKSQLATGAYVEVNGPHDTFGKVLTSKTHEEGFLNLIRGYKPIIGERATHVF